MTLVSINLNKVALLRNSRENDFPNVKYVANLAIISGCKGITIHPREDQRHATRKDVSVISSLPEVEKGKVSFNLEGDLREDIFDMVETYNVHQFTIVPVEKCEKTTERGFKVGERESEIKSAITMLKDKKSVRISIFIEPDIDSVDYAYSLGCDAVEIHCKWYAQSFCTNRESEEVKRVCLASNRAKEKNLRVHLGHDLSLVNLSMIAKKVKPDEVSVGHAAIVESLYQGFPRVIKKYMTISHSV